MVLAGMLDTAPAVCAVTPIAVAKPTPTALLPVKQPTERQILERELSLLQIDPKGGLYQLNDARSIRPGDRSDQLPTIRAAMISFGYLPTATPQPPAGADNATLYQEPLVGAVRQFQLEVGLQDDGVIGNATRRALRAMDGDRVLMIKQSLTQPEPRHAPRLVIINVAAGLAYAIQDGQPILVSRVIVGKPSTQTPLFSARIQSVTLNPIWTAPESIVEKEFGGNMHVSRPGPENPLGKIRIDMPNKYEIFLHSTNQPRFFRHDFRTYSHGCIRVEQIQALAKWLVGDPGWKAANADQALAGLKTLKIPLTPTVPVYLQYRTATVSSTGQVIYHADPYSLAAPPPVPAAKTPLVMAAVKVAAPPPTTPSAHSPLLQTVASQSVNITHH